MKGYLIPALLLSLILFVCFSVNSYSTSVLEKTLAEINTCTDSIRAADWEAATVSMLNATENLNKHIPMLEMFIHHQNLNEIRFSLDRTGSYILAENTEEALVEAENLILRIRIAVNSDKSTFSNLL